MNNIVEFEKVFITPELAKELLEKNDKNRKVRPNTVAFYVDQMKRGQWKEDTGEPIKIAPNGRVVDGQHRLFAIMAFGEGMYFHIARNIPEENFKVLDSGLKRIASDGLHSAGVPNADSISAGIKHWFTYKNKGSEAKLRSNASMMLSTEDILSEYNSRPEYWQSVCRDCLTYNRKFNRIVAPSVLMGWYALFTEINSIKAKEFMEKLCLGTNIANEKEVVNQLRNLLQKDKLARHPMTIKTRSGFMIKTWNYFFRDKEIGVLRFDELKDDFPILDTGGDEILAKNGTKKFRGAYKKKETPTDSEVNFIEN